MPLKVLGQILIWHKSVNYRGGSDLVYLEIYTNVIFFLDDAFKRLLWGKIHCSLLWASFMHLLQSLILSHNYYL